MVASAAGPSAPKGPTLYSTTAWLCDRFSPFADIWPWVETQIVPPVNIPISTKKWIYPKMEPLVLNHGHCGYSVAKSAPLRLKSGKPSPRPSKSDSSPGKQKVNDF